MSSANALHQLDGATLADRAYDAIREAIISGELSSQQKITERGLAVLLAVSPTPVREALRRLEQDGLVQRTGPRTVQVVDFDASTTKEIRIAEGALRVVVAGLAATNATEAQLARMERILDDGDRETRPAAGRSRRRHVAHPRRPPPLLAITREFHAELNAACNNPVILRLLRTVEAFKLATLPRDLTVEIEPRRRRGGGRAVPRAPGDVRGGARRRCGDRRTTDDRTQPLATSPLTTDTEHTKSARAIRRRAQPRGNHR